MDATALHVPIFASSPTPIPFAQDIFAATVDAVIAPQPDSPWDAVVGVEVVRGFSYLSGVPRIGYSMLFGRNKAAAEGAMSQITKLLLNLFIDDDARRREHVRSYQYEVAATKDRVVADPNAFMDDESIKRGLKTARLMVEAGIRLAGLSLYGSSVPQLQRDHPIVRLGGGLQRFDENDPHLMRFVRTLEDGQYYKESCIPSDPDTIYTSEPKGAIYSFAVYFLDRNARELIAPNTNVIDGQLHHSDPAAYSQAFVVSMKEFLAMLRSELRSSNARM